MIRCHIRFMNYMYITQTLDMLAIVNDEATKKKVSGTTDTKRNPNESVDGPAFKSSHFHGNPAERVA